MMRSAPPSNPVSGTPTDDGRGVTMNMAQRIAAHAWEQSELGASHGWSPTLNTALALCLGSRMCGCLYWGERHLVLYNDAYASILGTKHPWALGRPAAEVWPEIFHTIGPLLRQTYEQGTTTGGDDVPIFLNRSGYVEEFYCSFSYTALRSGSGAIEAVFATLPETSVRVIGERRLRTLQQLGSETRAARSPEQTLSIAAEVLGDNPYDVPFAGIYLWRDDAPRGSLVAAVGIEPGHALCPVALTMSGAGFLPGALRRSRANGYAVQKLGPEYHPLPCGGWKIPVADLIVVPVDIYGDGAPQAAFVAGISPHKALDDEYLTFFRMLADQLQRSLSEAYSHEQEALRILDMQRRAQAQQQAERVRIARDLHDTVLQSMQGMNYLLEVGLSQVEADPPMAHAMFREAAAAAEHAVGEGREVLSLLRASSPRMEPIEDALHSIWDELGAAGMSDFSVRIRGSRRRLDRDIWQEVHAICREAIANAVRHANAKEIAVQVEFGDNFRLSVSDDGRGIDDAIASGGLAGHYGLPGMRERALMLDGKLEVSRRASVGTRVVLAVPGSRAYEHG